MEIIVIGGGASGMAAAIAAAKSGAHVTLLERMNRPGRKLLITGNGRCNMTNTDPQLPGRYCSDDANVLAQLSQSVFEQFSVADTLAQFEKVGLKTVTKEELGCVYPRSLQSASVLSALTRAMEQTGIVKIKCNTIVKDITVEHSDGKQRFCVAVEGWQYYADKVILACGGSAAPATGSDGTGFLLARKLGHTINPTLPALTALKVSGNLPMRCSGDRTQGTVTLKVDGKTVKQESGEIQWTDKGISGIVVFNVSRYASRGLYDGRKVQAVIDLVPEMTKEELKAYLSSENLGSGNDLLSGLLPERTAAALIKEAGELKRKGGHGELTDLLADLLKELTLNVTGTRGLEQSQVSCGGVSLKQIDPATLESKVCKNLYIVGELLDVDGPCGGYNLQWAWSTGAVAGRHAAGCDQA